MREEEQTCLLAYDGIVQTPRESQKSGISSMYLTEGTGKSQGSVSVFEVTCRRLEKNCAFTDSELAEGKEQYMFLMNDITHILESQSKQMESYYQEAMLATVSHEQMNPLNSLINFTGYLKQKTKEYLDDDDSVSNDSDSDFISSSASESFQEQVIVGLRSTDLKN
mmetsp:Transcript_765/g.956  ORF Transcript_765/g.956 Transcript_765/m.956 type:complete len:166 (+) Transcript_765:336-833(+)|eukprot:CAMPEP_0170487810 /NCGR_PEP_ID=MMETSP0208-20121228/6541_1 /TAXON_ID=197538 /ORGANISM="Strombidium inclinatum, Strain S3" /LENGTH=165 /DNA_ID=CAMNT_0010762213 /DNA_START=264 /DNA_END=761 /DNA_ORIENTATION=+